MEKKRFIPLSERQAYHRFEDVIGCKWSSMVVAAVSNKVTRPGELERFIPGISTKVLNERLRKLVDFGVLTRTQQEGTVPRVDYALTDSGVKLASLLDQVRQLNLEHIQSDDSAN